MTNEMEQRATGVPSIKKNSHRTREEGMCVMEAVAYVAGLPHSDHPECTDPIITRICIVTNDGSGYRVRQQLFHDPKLLLRLAGSRTRNQRTLARRATLLLSALNQEEDLIRHTRYTKVTKDTPALEQAIHQLKVLARDLSELRREPSLAALDAARASRDRAVSELVRAELESKENLGVARGFYFYRLRRVLDSIDDMLEFIQRVSGFEVGGSYVMDDVTESRYIVACATIFNTYAGVNLQSSITREEGRKLLDLINDLLDINDESEGVTEPPIVLPTTLVDETNDIQEMVLPVALA